MNQGIDWTRFGPMLWEAAGQTVQMVGTAVVVGGFFGLIIGLALYLTRRGNLLENRMIFTAINVIINVVRPIPFIILFVALGPVTRAVV
ncbi:MAG: ABC transporter permease, partial [Cellulomonadaceae bacterium]|nr:ABC transporter permease [Cellulomonadaceae bacterium]